MIALGTIVAALSNPLARAGLIAAIALAAWGYVDRKATYRERARCNAAAIQSKLDAKEADLNRIKSERTKEKQDTEELGKLANRLGAENEKLKLEVSKRPVADQCVIPNRR